MKGYIEEWVLEIDQCIFDNNAIVRQAAEYYGLSKSVVYACVIIQNEPESELLRWWNKKMVALFVKKQQRTPSFFSLYDNVRTFYKQ